jgi:hypothetical protein
MKPKVIIYSLLMLALIFAVSCKGPKTKEDEHTFTKQEIAEEAIRSWMLNSNEHPHYKPVVFGDITPRYEKSNRTLQLSIQISEEQARSITTGNTEKLDSLMTEIEKYRGDLLGYLIPHKFAEKNLAGETLTKELLFFLDTALRVASVLSPESFDYIMDEKVFFRLDTLVNEKATSKEIP